MPHRLNHIIWVRLPPNATPFSKDGFADPVGDMPNSPHIGMVPYQISSDPPSTPIGVPPVPEDEWSAVTQRGLHDKK
jgi:choline dehydrogenase